VEFYLSPDGKRFIGIARREGDDFYRVHTLNIDGTDAVCSDAKLDASLRCEAALPQGDLVAESPPADTRKM
jgi:hypothetical protein